jgi:hypothetical protein
MSTQTVPTEDAAPYSEPLSPYRSTKARPLPIEPSILLPLRLTALLFISLNYFILRAACAVNAPVTESKKQTRAYSGAWSLAGAPAKCFFAEARPLGAVRILAAVSLELLLNSWLPA